MFAGRPRVAHPDGPDSLRDYLMAPSEELTRRYKGGGQWIVHRAIGRDLARRAEVWADPKLAIWGWQSPIYVYSGLDNVTRHFFGDPLMKAYIMGDFRGGNPRVESPDPAPARSHHAQFPPGLPS